MNADCIPVTALPHVSPIFRDYISGLASPQPAASTDKLSEFYSPLHRNGQWMQHPPAMDPGSRHAIVELLRGQNRSFGASPATFTNLDRLAEGAAAVVTGQQVALFGGPLLTLFKAATAIRLAAQASRNGHPHVPIFWLASEDHDFDEINQATFPDPTTTGFKTLRLAQNPAPGKPVGNIPLGEGILPLVEELRRCLGLNFVGPGPIADLLAEQYTPSATFTSAFAGFLTRIFSEHGLIVIDASSRPFHALAAPTLRAAIEHADAIHAALLARTLQLEQAGYHAQVMVSEASSLLFLVDVSTGIRTALKKTPGAGWSAGPRQYTTAELLAILDATPERISPNVLLRPVLQDTLLPTSVYIGGPAEVAYFAQCQVVYQQILGTVTPVLPRLSATLIDPRLAKIMERHQLSLSDVFTTSDALAQHLGARHMPVEGKRKLAAAGNALDKEISALTEWMQAQDPGLGHAAKIAGSKMLYQMNRLRRLSAAHTLQRDQSLRRHADALTQELFPQGNLQERVLAGTLFLARFQPGSARSLVDLILEHAPDDPCPHPAIPL